DLRGADAELVEDVRAVVQVEADGELLHHGGDAVDPAVPHALLPAGGGDRGQVRVLLDLVAGQVRGQVGDLALRGLPEAGRLRPGRHVDPVRQLVPGEQRGQRGDD